MKVNLSFGAAKLLKFVLSCTGEKEIDKKGQEINSPRRLNGEESSQRKHFTKAIEPLENETEEAISKMQKEHNEMVVDKRKTAEAANPKMPADEIKPAETPQEYRRRIDSILGYDEEIKSSLDGVQKTMIALTEKKFDVEVTDKTFAVMKKYYKEFGDKSGFVEGDDDLVVELENVLK